MSIKLSSSLQFSSSEAKLRPLSVHIDGRWYFFRDLEYPELVNGEGKYSHDLFMREVYGDIFLSTTVESTAWGCSGQGNVAIFANPSVFDPGTSYNLVAVHQPK